MDIIRLSKSFTFDQQWLEPLAITLGQFDGLHEAHKVLIDTTVQLAKAHHIKSAVLTFDPHPDFILKKQTQDTYLTPLDEKIEVLKAFGIDYLFIVEFDQEVANLPHQVFVEHYLLRLMAKVVVVGFDFRYGYRGLGNVNTLEEDGKGQFKVHVIPELKYRDEKIGSTLIRKLLEKGSVEEVKALLGRYYEIVGTVVEGEHIGRKINLPTANLSIREDYAFVLSGVYGVIVTVDHHKYIGICNLGHNPTFNYQINRRLEVHLIDYNGDLYGKTLRVAFVFRIRNEEKFNSLEAFQDQIKKDRQLAISLIKPLI